MTGLIIVLAILAYYFYRKAKHSDAYDGLSTDQLFKRLWYLPVVQLAVCLIVLFFAYFGVQVCMQQSPYLADAVRDNFGIFGTIGADLINQNLSDNLALLLVQADRLHGWSQYLLIAAVVSFGLQAYVLKEKKVSMEVILALTGAISVVAIILMFQISYTTSEAADVVVSNETLGLLSSDTGHALIQGLLSASMVAAILIAYHFSHYNYLARYYDEPVKDLNPLTRFVGKTQEQPVPAPKSTVQPAVPSSSASTTKRCPYCGEEIAASAVKCRYCGEWLNKEEEKAEKGTVDTTCPVCGEQIPADSKVCPCCKEPII